VVTGCVSRMTTYTPCLHHSGKIGAYQGRLISQPLILPLICCGFSVIRAVCRRKTLQVGNGFIPRTCTCFDRLVAHAVFLSVQVS